MLFYEPYSDNYVSINEDEMKEILKTINEKLNERLDKDYIIAGKDVMDELHSILGISNDIDEWEAD